MARANIVRQQVLDDNGDPVAGAKAYFYDTGTSTPQTVYSDSGLLTAHTTPLVADAAGTFPEIYISGGSVDVEVRDADDVTLDRYIMPAFVTQEDTLVASAVGVTPFTGVSSTNVQDALEEMYTELGTTSGDFRGLTLQFDDRQIDSDAVELATTTKAGVVEKSTTAENRAGTASSQYPSVAGVIEILEGETFQYDFLEAAYSFGTDGSQETITSSQLEDYFDYGAVIQSLSHDSGSSQALYMTLIRESDSAGTAIQIGASIAASATWNGIVKCYRTRLDRPWVEVIAMVSDSTVETPTWTTDSAFGGLISAYARRYIVTFDADDKVKQIQFSTTAGVNFDNGTINLTRTRVGSKANA